jgi:hypothetical protein
VLPLAVRALHCDDLMFIPDTNEDIDEYVRGAYSGASLPEADDGTLPGRSRRERGCVRRTAA